MTLRRDAMAAVRTVVSVAAAMAASVVVLAPVIGDLLDRARTLDTATGGTRLALLTPMQLVGLESFSGMSNIDPVDHSTFLTSTMPSASSWWLQVGIVMAVTIGAAVVAVRTRRRFPLFAALAAGLVLFGYRVVFAHYGVSYQQWKWITFYSPFLVLAVVVAGFVLVDALRVLYPRWLFPTVVGAAVGVALALLMVISSHRVWSKDWPTVTADLADLHRVAASGLDRVNLDVGAWGDTLWADYYLMPLATNSVSASFFRAVPDRSGWTIMPAGSITGAPAKVVPVNATYSLVCAKEPCGTSPVLPTR